MTDDAVTWTIDQACALVAELWPAAEAIGWHLGVTGSALYRTYSTRDLDLIAYPRDTSNPPSREALADLLKSIGWRRRSDVVATRQVWRNKGSRDRKSVEVWATGKSDGDRRVDLFIMDKNA